MKKYSLCFICMFIALLNGYTQSNDQGELDQLYPELDDTQKTVMEINQQAFSYYYSNPDSTVLIARKALSLAEEINFELGSAWAKQIIGGTEILRGNYSVAIKECRHALQVFKKHQDHRGVSECLNTIGLSYIYFGDTLNAIKSFEENTTTTELIDENGYVKSLNNLGSIYYYKKAYEDALFCFRKSLKLSVKKGFTLGVGLNLNNIGLCLIGLNKFESGIDSLLRANELFLTIENKKYVCESNFWLGKSYLNVQDYAQAIPYATKAYQQTYHTKDLATRKKTLLLLAEIFTKLEDFAKVADYQNRYIQLSDSLHEAEKSTISSNLEANVKLENKEIELSNQKKVNSTQKYFTFLIIAFLVMSLVLAYQIFQRFRKESRTNQLLSDQNAQIQQQKEEIQEQTKHLSEVNAAKDKVFAILGHNLRSPINILKSWLELMQQNSISREEFMEISDELKSRVDNVYFTLNNLLIWAKNQLQGFVPAPEHINLKEISKASLILFKDIAASKDIQVDNTIPDQATAWADKDHVQLVFRNLLSNAFKFTPEKGQITLYGEYQENVRAWQVVVKDSGIGISEDNLKKLFDEKDHVSTKGINGEKGTGLGLLLSKEMVDKNDGELWVESQPGKGTAFYLKLPKTAPKPELQNS